MTRLLAAARLPQASEFLGLDAAEKMIEVARSASPDERLKFVQGTAERLPADDSAYDVVVSTTSFDHWTDQAAGIRECARAHQVPRYQADHGRRTA